MLTFLLPNSIFSSRTTARGSQGLRSLTRRQQRTRPAKASTSRSFADNAEDYVEGPGSIESNRKQGEHIRWLLTQGQQYRRPNENGPNWLGGSVVRIIQPYLSKKKVVYIFLAFSYEPIVQTADSYQRQNADSNLQFVQGRQDG
jgi:hypothetical protein